MQLDDAAFAVYTILGDNVTLQDVVAALARR